MVQRVKLAMLAIAFGIILTGCSDENEPIPENASIPGIYRNQDEIEDKMVPKEASTTSKHTSIYKKTYVYHDTEFNRKPVPFRVLKLDTKKTYKVAADEERLTLLDAANRYFKELAKIQGLSKAEYSVSELEYVYELNDQLLYMPVYLQYNGGKMAGEEVLYNLIIEMGEGTFELVGQTDRALLDEEKYPRRRLLQQKRKKEMSDYPVDDKIYNGFFLEGKRIEDGTIRNYFMEQMKQYLTSELLLTEDEDTIRIGVVDVVKNTRNAYFSLLEIVFYDTNNNIEKVKRYQAVELGDSTQEVLFSDLGAFRSIAQIAPDDYCIVTEQELYASGILGEEP